MQRLKKLTGKEFDREYMKMMVDDHHEDIRAFQHEAQSGDDPEVKAFASKTLPTLREHLGLAEKARSAAASAAGGKPGTTSGAATSQSGQKQQ